MPPSTIHSWTYPSFQKGSCPTVQTRLYFIYYTSNFGDNFLLIYISLLSNIYPFWSKFKAKHYHRRMKFIQLFLRCRMRTLRGVPLHPCQQGSPPHKCVGQLCFLWPPKVPRHLVAEKCALLSCRRTAWSLRPAWWPSVTPSSTPSTEGKPSCLHASTRSMSTS